MTNRRIIHRLTFSIALASLVMVSLGIASFGLDEVTVQLKWLHQTQHAGFYAAVVNGLYEEAGLDVSLLEGGPTVDITRTVLDGTAQFGVAAADELIAARAEGLPVRALAVVYRRNPLVFVADADSGIETPQDFVGHTVLAALNSIPTLHAMMAFVGVPRESYSAVTLPYDVELFASGEATIWGVYVNGSIRLLRDAGYELNVISPDDYGVHFYADTLFASDALIASNPGLVDRFLRATLAGWEWAVAEPEQAGALSLQFDPDLNLSDQVEQMVASLPLIQTGEGEIGWMLGDTWLGMHDTLVAQGLLDPFDVSETYTMRFLEAIYDDE